MRKVKQKQYQQQIDKDANYFRNMTYNKLMVLIERATTNNECNIKINTKITSTFKGFLENKGFSITSITLSPSSYIIGW